MTYFQVFAFSRTQTHRKFFQFRIDLGTEDYLTLKIIAVFFILLSALTLVVGLSMPDTSRQRPVQNNLLDRAIQNDPCHYNKLPTFDDAQHGHSLWLHQICEQ